MKYNFAPKAITARDELMTLMFFRMITVLISNDVILVSSNQGHHGRWYLVLFIVWTAIRTHKIHPEHCYFMPVLLIIHKVYIM